MPRLHARSLGVVSVLALACSSQAATIRSSTDGGDVGPACGASFGADRLSFDVECTGTCATSKHVTFDVSAAARKQAPCTEAGGHLQFFQLTGDDKSVFSLDLDPTYDGAGSYVDLGSMGDLAYSNVAAMCAEFGATDLELTLPEATDPKGTCAVDVTEDCTTAKGHALSGSFNCTLPVADRGASCMIKNGSFSFKACP